MSTTTTADPTTAADTSPPPQRDAQGRFLKGNFGGPGNPFARQCALLRKTAAEVVTEQDTIEIMHAMMIRAKTGDVAAARFVFSYSIGRPAEAADPDRLNLEEWKLLRECIPTTEDAEGAARGVPVDFMLKIARMNRDIQDAKLTRQLLEGAGHPEEGRKYEEDRLGRRVDPPPAEEKPATRPGRPMTNGDQSGRPMTNGGGWPNGGLGSLVGEQDDDYWRQLSELLGDDEDPPLTNGSESGGGARSGEPRRSQTGG